MSHLNRWTGTQKIKEKWSKTKCVLYVLENKYVYIDTCIINRNTCVATTYIKRGYSPLSTFTAQV